jgi:hypothetical protein
MISALSPLQAVSSSLSTKVRHIAQGGINGANATLSIPAHLPGDIILLMTGNQLVTPPATRAGYTFITSAFGTNGANRSFTLQWRRSTTGAAESFNVPVYGVYAISRGGTRIGSVNTLSVNAAPAVTVDLPTITPSSPTSQGVVYAGTYLGVVVATSAPYTNLGNHLGVVPDNRLTSIAGTVTNLTGGGSTFVRVTWAVEII